MRQRHPLYPLPRGLLSLRVMSHLVASRPEGSLGRIPMSCVVSLLSVQTPEPKLERPRLSRMSGQGSEFVRTHLGVQDRTARGFLSCNSCDRAKGQWPSKDVPGRPEDLTSRLFTMLAAPRCLSQLRFPLTGLGMPRRRRRLASVLQASSRVATGHALRAARRLAERPKSLL